MKKALHLYDASDAFPEMFWRERLRLRALLGESVAIEHVGSTAVEGLSGKGTIDIAIGVATIEDIQPTSAVLSNAGYFFDLDHESPTDRMFLASREHDSTFGDYHLYVVVKGEGQWNELVGFRDRLRRDASLKKEYMELKHMLYDETEADREKYKQKKGDFITRVLEKSHE